MVGNLENIALYTLVVDGQSYSSSPRLIASVCQMTYFDETKSAPCSSVHFLLITIIKLVGSNHLSVSPSLLKNGRVTNVLERVSMQVAYKFQTASLISKSN